VFWSPKKVKEARNRQQLKEHEGSSYNTKKLRQTGIARRQVRLRMMQFKRGVAQKFRLRYRGRRGKLIELLNRPLGQVGHRSQGSPTTQQAVCLRFDCVRSPLSSDEECGSSRAASLEKDRRYRASGLVGGLTAALLLRDVRGDRVAMLGKAFVGGHCRGRNRSEKGVFRNRRG
jgi:hypothetical protein